MFLLCSCHISMIRYDGLITANGVIGCYIVLLRGTIKEEIYNHSLYKIKTNIHKAPSISYMNNKLGLHSIEPLKKSISIHLYYPKKHITNYYQIK